MTDESIKAEGYTENPPADYKHYHQYGKNLEMFRKSGKILYPPTLQMYTYIKNYCIDFAKNHPQYPDFVWKPKIIDIGCGGGFGSNIMSQEADFVWGIDVSEPNIHWCNTVFKREKNGVYYSPQVSFDVFDPITDPREVMAFDIVVCIEVIEHVQDYQKLIEFMKKRCKKDKKRNWMDVPDATKVFISSPNRNHHKISEEKPKNKFHVREWTAGELYDVLTKHFKYVQVLTTEGKISDTNMAEQIALFKCEVPNG